MTKVLLFQFFCPAEFFAVRLLAFERDKLTCATLKNVLSKLSYSVYIILMEEVMANEIVEQVNTKMQTSVDALKRELVKIRTGRASLALLDGIKVDAYGSLLPVDQVGTMTIPESRMIVIQPWDPQMLPVIEKAILSSDLGLTPANDGKVIRLTIPQLTEERRKDLVKQVKKVAEEFKVAVRNVRREANDMLKKLKKDKEISEDDMFRLQEEAQKATDAFVKKIDEIAVGKEKEVMEV